ncbi:hypothetical protein RIF29_40418 [Crotalaria pallida]|uniref:Hydroxyproline O-arabinosyltransferase-like domain-containing protein n=1 Tax=Crotalaria pallida TaxID=3830 RepID=A0AAN9E3V1_CROPI
MCVCGTENERPVKLTEATKLCISYPGCDYACCGVANGQCLSHSRFSHSRSYSFSHSHSRAIVLSPDRSRSLTLTLARSFYHSSHSPAIDAIATTTLLHFVTAICSKVVLAASIVGKSGKGENSLLPGKVSLFLIAWFYLSCLGYIVLNRPWAFVQWLEKTTIEEEYVLMAEPDHIFVRPLPNLAHGGHPAAFPFFYIRPDQNEKVIRKFYPEEFGAVTNVDPIGNSPLIIRKDLIAKIAPTWMNISLKMKNDPETDKAFGWVLEMYAYAVASALHGVRHILRKDFMLQPPWDLETTDKYIIHYTYGCDYNLKVTLVKMVNEATANIPNWDTS